MATKSKSTAKQPIKQKQDKPKKPIGVSQPSQQTYIG